MALLVTLLLRHKKKVKAPRPSNPFYSCFSLGMYYAYTLMLQLKYVHTHCVVFLVTSLMEKIFGENADALYSAVDSVKESTLI